MITESVMTLCDTNLIQSQSVTAGVQWMSTEAHAFLFVHAAVVLKAKYRAIEPGQIQ